MRSSLSISLVALAASAALTATAACGGAATSDLFDSPASDGAEDSGGPSSEPDASGTQGDVDATPPDHGHPIGPGSEDSGTPVTPHPDASVVDAGPAPIDSSVGPDPTNFGVYCGVDVVGTEHYCALKVGACCATSFNNGSPPSYACVGTLGVQCTGTRIDCDDSADCASGQVCCGKLVSNRYQAVTCQAKCESTSTAQAVRFCNPNAAVDECEPLGLQCSESTALPGFYRCG